MKKTTALLKEYYPYIIVFLLVIAIWFAWRAYIIGLHKVEDNNAGEYGDSFGVVNSFFSALAFAGVVLTIYLQNKELSETRAEFKQQNDTLIHQRFENTFFQMLRFHTDNVYSIDVTKLVEDEAENQVEGLQAKRKVKKEVVEGKDSFKVLYDNLLRRYWHYQQDQFMKRGISTSSQDEFEFNIKKEILPLSQLIRLYNRVYNVHEADLGHYFKTMYRLVKLVDQARHFTDTSEASVIEQKKFYTGMFRAQLSTFEEYLLAHNCIGQHGEKFRILINRYDILKGCNFDKMYAGKVIEQEIKNRVITTTSKNG